MSIDVEYALKKDVRNNPINREVDTRQERELGRIVWLAAFAVAMLLFSAWQHYEMLNYSIQIERARVERAREEVVNRQLRLNLETLRSPQELERRARQEAGLVAPAPEDTLIIERATESSPAGDVVARAE